MTFPETWFPSSQCISVTKAHVQDEKGAQLREKNCQVFLVLETWVQVQLFFVFIMDLSKLLAFPSSTSPEWSRAPVSGWRSVKAFRAGPASPATPAHGAEQCVLPRLCRWLGLYRHSTGTGRARGGGEARWMLHAYCFTTLVQSN